MHAPSIARSSSRRFASGAAVKTGGFTAARWIEGGGYRPRRCGRGSRRDGRRALLHVN